MNFLSDRRQEEKERRRAEILDAAMAVARTVGLQGVTMDLVARQARLSRALIYVYFRDREELVFGLCQRAHVLLLDRFRHAMADQVIGIEKVRACGRAYVAFARELPLEFEILARFEAHTTDAANVTPCEAACLLAGDAINKLLVEAIVLGIADGSIRADVGPPTTVAVTLWGFLHGVLQLALNKANVLAHEGVGGEQLIQQAIAMAGRSIASARTIEQEPP